MRGRRGASLAQGCRSDGTNRGEFHGTEGAIFLSREFDEIAHRRRTGESRHIGTLGIIFERDAWVMPSPTSWSAIVYNAVLVFGFAHAAWFYLARTLPPVASTLSVMFIPILGVFVGAYWLGEVLHWQDWAAVALMVVAIASVLAPSRSVQAELQTASKN